MKGRLIWLLFGALFSVTLALIVGQRLSAEGMAVVIGVIAGVAASIPTSLVVVWFMGQSNNRPILEAAAPMRAAEPVEPRIVVMPAPQPQPQPAGYPAGYGAQSYAGYPQSATAYGGASPAYAAPSLPARRFTVIGGGDGAVEEPSYVEETVTWQR
jgi:hypothetical protein